jgi:Family of unknown function (DUF5670)
MRSMLLILAILLLLAWIGSFVVYHVAGFLIHLLLVVAIISFVFSLITGKRAV